MAAYLTKSRTVELAVPFGELVPGDIIRTRSGRILEVAKVSRRYVSNAGAVWFVGVPEPTLVPHRGSGGWGVEATVLVDVEDDRVTA